MAQSLHTYKVAEMPPSKERKISALIPHAHSRYVALNYQVISELQIRSFNERISLIAMSELPNDFAYLHSRILSGL